jgi:hypothetical protein
MCFSMVPPVHVGVSLRCRNPHVPRILNSARFNVTAQSYSYDNRPMVPLMQRSFNDWWFVSTIHLMAGLLVEDSRGSQHGHLDHPPNAGDFFELPAGGTATGQLACDKGATDFYSSDPG